MTKNGPGTPSRPTNARHERKVGSPSHVLSDGIVDKTRGVLDPEILAKVEKIRAQFQAAFGHHLKAARLKAGLKQSDVAARTGLTQQYLSLIEAGQQNITVKTMILLAEVVDRDVRDMLRKVIGTSRKD